MRTLGLLGGMSWKSTEIYYRLINEAVAREKGGLHSAKILLHSFDFAEMAALQKAGDWAKALALMVEAALKLKLSGAEALVICTNTMHMFAPDLEAATGLPVLHIVDAVAEAMAAKNIHKAGILGTYFTMTMPFYADRYRKTHGITLVAPAEEAMQTVNRVIYEELCQSVVKDASRAEYVTIMDGLRAQGAEAIILGCTEICLLIESPHYPALPLFDSTALHAEYAAAFACGTDQKIARVS